MIWNVNIFQLGILQNKTVLACCFFWKKIPSETYSSNCTTKRFKYFTGLCIIFFIVSLQQYALIINQILVKSQLSKFWKSFARLENYLKHLIFCLNHFIEEEHFVCLLKKNYVFLKKFYQKLPYVIYNFTILKLFL